MRVPRLKPGVTVAAENTNGANGLTLDLQGRLISLDIAGSSGWATSTSEALAVSVSSIREGGSWDALSTV